MAILKLEYNCRHIEGTRFAALGSEPSEDQLVAFFSMSQLTFDSNFIRAAREAIKTGRNQHWKLGPDAWGDIFVTPVDVLGLA